MSAHPAIVQASRLYVAQPDRIAAITRQTHEYETEITTLGRMAPGDAAALPTLRRTIDLLAGWETEFGAVRGWTLAQRHHLHREALRLLGHAQTFFTAPGWSEV